MKVELLDFMGSDLTTVNAARVSFDKESSWIVDFEKENYDLSEKDKKLINYLAKEGHYSPFGHSFLSFRITAPVFVARQLVKHEYLRMNEVSRRYVDTPPEFYTPEVWRGKPKDKKQGSEGVVDINSIKEMEGEFGAIWTPEELYPIILETYKALLSSGVAPEQARMVLPQSMYTSWYWSGSLDAFANMYKLRTGGGAQEETKEIALMIGEEITNVFPISWKELTNA